MNCVQKINSLKTKIENAEYVLVSKMDNTPCKDDCEALLSQVRANIMVIEREHKILSKQNKKQKNRTLQKNANSRLKECTSKIANLKMLIERQSERLEKNELGGTQEIEEEESGQETHVNNAATLQFYENEDVKFQGGVVKTKEMLASMKLANLKLDDISMLVFEQRNKLNSIQGEIKQSQNLMNQTKKIMKAFSAELVKDKAIRLLLGLITVILLFIMVCAIKYKLKSQALIGKEIDVTDQEVDYNEINEALFWRAEIKETNKKGKGKQKVTTSPQVRVDLMEFDIPDKSDQIENQNSKSVDRILEDKAWN